MSHARHQPQETGRVLGETSGCESPLRVWFRRVRRAQWTTFAELRATFPTADQVGRMIVINICGNRFRLIAAIHFNRGKVYIRHVLTHADYDRGDWKQN